MNKDLANIFFNYLVPKINYGKGCGRAVCNGQIFDLLEWIAVVTVHIPNKREQMERYYGYYSNVKRGQYKKKVIVMEQLSNR